MCNELRDSEKFKTPFSILTSTTVLTVLSFFFSLPVPGALPMVTATVYCLGWPLKWFIIISYSLLCIWGLYKVSVKHLSEVHHSNLILFSYPLLFFFFLLLVRNVGHDGFLTVATATLLPATLHDADHAHVAADIQAGRGEPLVADTRVFAGKAILHICPNVIIGVVRAYFH